MSLEKIEKAMKALPSPWIFKWTPLGKGQTRIDREIAEEERAERETEGKEKKDPSSQRTHS